MNSDPSASVVDGDPASSTQRSSASLVRDELRAAGPSTVKAMTQAGAVSSPAGADSVWPHDEPEGEDAQNGSLILLLGFVGLFLVLGAFRSWWIPGIVAGLMFMLFMHELGHYATARASGMKVTEFFLGFGPKIWSFTRGETEYGVKALPAGAYVRIIGMTNLDEIDPTEESQTYRAQPWWQRMVVISAGSAMHFLMAIVALVVLFGAYGYAGFNGPAWQVDRVIEGSSASSLGIEPGDQITRFAGEEFATWSEFGDIVVATEIGPIEVEVERNGQRLVLVGELGARSGDVVGNGFGLVVNEDRASQGWTVAAVREGGSADLFGFELDDVLLRADGVARPSQLAFAQVLQSNEGDQLDIVVLRNGDEVTLDGVVSLDRSLPFRGFLGVGPDWVDPEPTSWAQAVPRAFGDFWTVARINVGGLASLLNPLNLIDGIGGGGEAASSAPATSPASQSPAPAAQPDEGSNRPVSIIGIARLFAESESVDQALYLFMIVNIFVGLFNLVPLLPLDGGHAALATWQKVRQVVTRRPDYRVDAARLIPLTWVVIGVLVFVGLWAAVLDIFAWPA